MFNLGPMELLVLAIVGIVVIGPEKLPGLARDAAGLIRTLRDLATGARQQLHDELGPEFADMDLRNLNPRTAVQRMVFGEDTDLGKFNPKTMMRDAVLGDADLRDVDPRVALRDATTSFKKSYSYTDPADEAPAANGRANGRANGSANGSANGKVNGSVNGSVSFAKPASDSGPAASRPRPRPRPSYGDDIT